MSFGIEFTRPHAGWLDVTITFDGVAFGFAASAVLNDPVRELAELALFVATGEYGRVAVRCWLEPAGYELAAIRGDDLQLALSYGVEADPIPRHPRLEASMKVEAPRAIASEILRCLRDLEPQVSVDGDRERWPYAFPAAQVAQLAESLRT